MSVQRTKIQKVLVVFLCFWVAFFEGFDLQAPGIAAKGIAESFSLDQIQMGYGYPFVKINHIGLQFLLIFYIAFTYFFWLCSEKVLVSFKH